MITLTQMPRIGGIPNLSPPCMKLETWLRMTGIAYEIGPFDTSRAPKGKLPYFEVEGGLASDATLALDFLRARHRVDPDAHLSPGDAAVALAFRRLLKEHFYWVLVYTRWHADESYADYFPIIGQVLPPSAPAPARRHVLDGLRSSLLDQLRQQGMGRHTPEEVHRLGIADLAAVSEVLGDKPYFCGADPATVDATIYAAVSNLIDVPVDSPVRDFALGRANLVAHARRMAERYFPELGD